MGLFLLDPSVPLSRHSSRRPHVECIVTRLLCDAQPRVSAGLVIECHARGRDDAIVHRGEYQRESRVIDRGRQESLHVNWRAGIYTAYHLAVDTMRANMLDDAALEGRRRSFRNARPSGAKA